MNLEFAWCSLGLLLDCAKRVSFSTHRFQAHTAKGSPPTKTNNVIESFVEILTFSTFLYFFVVLLKVKVSGDFEESSFLAFALSLANDLRSPVCGRTAGEQGDHYFSKRILSCFHQTRLSSQTLERRYSCQVQIRNTGSVWDVLSHKFTSLEHQANHVFAVGCFAA
jgi:hypothetical protein